jgi:signal transduction histidine kinase
VGAVVSRRFAERLGQVNQVARDVAAGDLQRRVPRNFSGDELDELAENLNTMLGRIERLTAGLRHAGDAIAHDLRSPLTRLRTSLEAGLRAAEHGASGEETLREALSDTEDLLATFNAVLRIARLESGERRETLSLLDPAEIVSDLAELYEPVAEDASLAFETDIQTGLEVLGDRELISQALANLLDNAIKYCPEGGTVTLRLRRTAEGEREISVADTGPGIPQHERERVLERFVRLESSRSLPGAGLGLSLVKAVADIHNGHVRLGQTLGADEQGGPGLTAALVLPAPK